MQPGFRIAGPFGPGLLVVDDRSGFAAGIPRAQQLAIAPVPRELPLDIWFRIDGLPIKLGYRWFPASTAGAPGDLVQAVIEQIVGSRSLDAPQIGRGMPEQLQRWNVEAAGSAVFARPAALTNTMPSLGPADPDGFIAEEAFVLYRRDRGILVVYKRFDPGMRPPDWAAFQSFVNASMVWDPINYRIPTPPPERRSSFVRPGVGLALLPEREAEIPALTALLRREIRPGDDRLEKFMWGMLKGSEPLETPVPPMDLMERVFENMIESAAVSQQLLAHYAQLQITLDLKGMATMYLRALGKNA